MIYYILAGGKSRRMGRNKALLRLDGMHIIERVMAAIPATKTNIRIVTNTPERYRFLNCQVVPDIYANLGPISGLHAGLTDSTFDFNFFLACDLPFLSRRTIELLLDAHHKQEVLAASTRTGEEPLCAIYAKSCLRQIESQIAKKEYRLQSLFEHIPADFVQVCEEHDLFNLNTKADWATVQKGQSRRSNEIDK